MDAVNIGGVDGSMQKNQIIRQEKEQVITTAVIKTRSINIFLFMKCEASIDNQ
jgi:hypothetical protein